jgi:hypothetical protein
LTDKLQFQSHKFNIQNYRLSIDLKQIKEVTFYNTLGIIPNGLKIFTIDEKTEKFVLIDRQLWKKDIENIKAIAES